MALVAASHPHFWLPLKRLLKATSCLEAPMPKNVFSKGKGGSPIVDRQLYEDLSSLNLPPPLNLPLLDLRKKDDAGKKRHPGKLVFVSCVRCRRAVVHPPHRSE